MDFLYAHKIIQRLADALPSERKTMMTFADELKRKGQQEGEHQKALVIAKTRLGNGTDLNFIQKVTELSEKEVVKPL